MTNTELIVKLRNMAGAYTIYSEATHMPYVECEPVDFYDLAYIFDKEEDADAFAQKIREKGNQVRTVELNSLEIEDVPGKKLYRNRLREHLMKFPTIGLNAVCYKAQDDEPAVLKLSDVLPKEVRQRVDSEVDESSGLKLTGIYYAQYLHGKEREMSVLRDLSEEFCSNLTNALLYMPVAPNEEHLSDEKLDITKCDLPCITLKNADEDRTVNFLALFTGMDEVAAYCRHNPAKTRIARLSLEGAYNLLHEPMVGCIIDPMSINIPVRREDIPKLVEAGKNRILS